jgi:hypothetical protein
MKDETETKVKSEELKVSCLHRYVSISKEI